MKILSNSFKRLRNNLWLKIFAVVLAVVSSVMVKVMVTPDGEIPTQSVFTKEITVIAPTNSDLIPTISQKEVTVTLKGQRSVLQRVVPSAISVELDLSLRDKPGNTFESLSVRPPSGTEVSAVEPMRVWAQVSKREMSSVPVKVRYLGEAAAGCSAGVAMSAPDKVKIVGPAEDIERVSVVEALVSLSGAGRTFSTRARTLFPIDASGSTISTVKVRGEGVDVTVPILAQRAINVDLANVTLPQNKNWNYTVSCEPKRVMVEEDASQGSRLSKLDSVAVEKTAFTHAPGLQERHVRLLLPEGCSVVGNDSGTVLVSVIGTSKPVKKLVKQGDKVK